MFYQATLTEVEGRILVEFPDCPGCVTDGATQAEALINAQEALEGWLEAHLGMNNTPPRPSFSEGVKVAVPLVLSMVLLLRWHRSDNGLTQAAAAKLVGVSQQQIARLEDPDANPTLEMLARVAKGYGVVLDVNLARVAEPA